MVVVVLYALAGALAAVAVLSPVVQAACPPLTRKVDLPLWEPTCLATILLAPASLASAAAWFVQRESAWALRDAFSTTIVVLVLRTLRLRDPSNVAFVPRARRGVRRHLGARRAPHHIPDPRRRGPHHPAPQRPASHRLGRRHVRPRLGCLLLAPRRRAPAAPRAPRPAPRAPRPAPRAPRPAPPRPARPSVSVSARAGRAGADSLPFFIVVPASAEDTRGSQAVGIAPLAAVERPARPLSTCTSSAARARARRAAPRSASRAA